MENGAVVFVEYDNMDYEALVIKLHGKKKEDLRDGQSNSRTYGRTIRSMVVRYGLWSYNGLGDMKIVVHEKTFR